MAGLRHPNVVQVFAWREKAGEHYLIEQYVPGGSLADRLRRDGALPWQAAARYIADVGEGLLEVHGRGILHRDIKPDNLLWDSERDEALLTDFGVSARLGDVGSAAGTPLYMAPEAFQGKPSPAADVYGLAATLFCLVTGQLPFPSAPIPALIARIVDGLPDPDPRCRGLPEPLERLVRAGLAARPDQRPALREFIERLRGALNQLLADSLSAGPREAAVGGLRLIVSRETTPGVFRPVATTSPAPGRLTRDMKRVPPPPEQVHLRTGDRVRVEVAVDQDGHVAVFNVGPTGNLNLLHPDELPATAVRAGRPRHVLDVELSPPAGLFAVWTREPLRLASADLMSLSGEAGAVASRPYQATRDMKRVRQSVEQTTTLDRRIAVLELEHIA